MLPSQVSRKWGGRERFRGQQPLGSDFPCFTTTKIVFQEACLKEFSPSSPKEERAWKSTFLSQPATQCLGLPGSSTQYCKGNSASPSLLTAQFKREKTLSCPQSYPTATQPGNARFRVFLFRNLFTAAHFHTDSRWFDSEPNFQNHDIVTYKSVSVLEV